MKGRKYPKYTHGFVDHDGKSRFYLRLPGRKRVPLPGLPWSPEFMEARQKALDGDWTVPELGASRTKAGTVNAALVSYYQSSAFKDGLSEGSQRMRRPILERFREVHGDKRIALIHKKALQAILNKKSPAAASNWRKALRGFIDHCLSLDMIATDPLAGIKLASRMVIIPGSRKSALNSRRTTSSGPRRGWPTSCCCRLGNPAAT
jgi:hypothetical protein